MEGNKRSISLEPSASLVRRAVNKLTAHLNYAENPVHKAGVELRREWNNKVNNRDEAREALSRYFQHAIAQSLVGPNELASLCMLLMEEQPAAPGTFHTPVVEEWLLTEIKNFKH